MDRGIDLWIDKEDKWTDGWTDGQTNRFSLCSTCYSALSPLAPLPYSPLNFGHKQSMGRVRIPLTMFFLWAAVIYR